MKSLRYATSGLLLFLALTGLNAPTADAAGSALRGWLSDEGCARGRASDGVYTGTNPDCARQCVAKGAKIVLILPEEKCLLIVENQGAAKSNVGNYVEVSGSINSQAATIHIDSLKLIEAGKAMCGIPPKKQQ